MGDGKVLDLWVGNHFCKKQSRKIFGKSVGIIGNLKQNEIMKNELL